MILNYHVMGAVINESVILCLFGTFWGFFVLTHYLKITHKKFPTQMLNAFPALLGTLAWASAAFIFATSPEHDSPIDGQRLMMIVSWTMLASQYRKKYKPPQ